MTSEEQKNLWNTFHRFYKSRVRSYSPKVNEALKKQVRQFIDAVRSGVPQQQALTKVTSGPILTVLKPLYLDAGITYGAKVLTYLRRQKARMPIGFNRQMTELIIRYFQTELLNDAENISQATRDKIQQVLIESYPLGRSFDEIVSLLTDAEFTAIRARLIARTETNTAANTGAMLAAKTTGLKLNKIWISAQDDRTRRVPRDENDHLHMNGQIIPYDDLFTIPGDGEKMANPGDRKHGAGPGNLCNCRCTIGFKAVRDASGRLITE